MTYQEIGQLLFPIWLTGCGLAALVNLWDRRTLMLTLFYSTFVIALFQLKYDGMAQVLGADWYKLVIGLQLLVIMCSYFAASRASRPICFLAWLSVGVNLAYAVGHHLDWGLPRHGYFVGVTTVQALQILSLITFSGTWTLVLRGLAKLKTGAKKRSWPWLRTAHSGRI